MKIFYFIIFCYLVFLCNGCIGFYYPRSDDPFMSMPDDREWVAVMDGHKIIRMVPKSYELGRGQRERRAVVFKGYGSHEGSIFEMKHNGDTIGTIDNRE